MSYAAALALLLGAFFVGYGLGVQLRVIADALYAA